MQDLFSMRHFVVNVNTTAIEFSGILCLNILGKINYKEMYLNNHHLAKFIIDWSSASEDTCLICHMTSRTRDGRISWRTSLHVTLPSLLTIGIVVVETKCF